MRAALVDLNLPEEQRIDLLPGVEVRIGRHRSNTIVVQDEHCSRTHAKFVPEGQHWVLHDMSSQNGCYVGGVRIESPRLLRSGQELQFGGLRYRFEQEDVPGADVEDDPVSTPQPDSAVSVLDETTFQVDQLSALCRFMAEATNETDPRRMLRRALETVQVNTSADVVGFISLDEEGKTVPRLVLPDGSDVDTHLSKHLTSEVQKHRRVIWLKNERDRFDSDSLHSYSDAICVPMPLRDRWLGALHAYRKGRAFSDLAARFCEVIARHLAECLRHLRRSKSLQAENSRLRAHDLLADRLVGRSAATKKLDEDVQRAARHDTTVLIRGETGVGKELVARALHVRSPWAEGPFDVVNCAAIRPELFESHLFGHRKGAFTGATANRDGAFLHADGGTLFLDEIGELPPDAQAKLLRVLEDGLVQAVGADECAQVHVRVIAATNRDIEAMIATGKFRHDLLYRLREVEIKIPPLRTRREDIPDLVEYYLDELEKKHGRRGRLTPQALHQLSQHSWPGNVRELVGALNQAIVMSPSGVIDVGDLQLWGEARPGALPTLNLRDLERLAYEEALRRTHHNVAEMRALLGASRATIYAKLKEYGWTVDRHKEEEDDEQPK